MRFIIATQELNYLINKCLNVVSQKPTVPILSNFLIEAKDGELVITATDLTVGVRCLTEAKILEEGATTLSAKRFSSLIREIKSVNVEVYTNENEVTEIIADSSRFKLHGMSCNEYPCLPDLTEATSIELPQQDLKQVFYHTSFAVSRNDERFALTGVFLHVENGKAKFVATDGKRLARSHLSIDMDPAFSGGYVVPLKAVEEIIKNLDGESNVTLYLMDDKLAIATENTLLITKLISEDYPDIESVIPEKADIVVSLHKEELMTLLRQVSLFTAEDRHSVKFSFLDGELRLSINNMDIGEGKVSMPVNYHGPQLDIAFDPNYFLDVLRNTKEEETVLMGLTDSFNPGVVTHPEEEQVPYSTASPLFVLMPMRLVGE